MQDAPEGFKSEGEGLEATHAKPRNEDAARMSLPEIDP